MHSRRQYEVDDVNQYTGTAVTTTTSHDEHFDNDGFTHYSEKTIRLEDVHCVPAEDGVDDIAAADHRIGLSPQVAISSCVSARSKSTKSSIRPPG